MGGPIGVRRSVVIAEQAGRGIQRRNREILFYHANDAPAVPARRII